MRAVRLALVGPLAGLLAAVVMSPSACTVAALQGAVYDGPKNTCNAGCGDAAECIEGACKASKTSYKMIVEVTPPSSAHYANDVTFSIEDLGGGNGGDHELRLPELARITLTVDASSVVGAAGLPLTLRLVRVGYVPGLAQGSYEARTAEGATFLPGHGSVSIEVPPGTYDVYLAPLSPLTPDVLALVPPLVLGQINFPSGPQERVFVVGALKSFDLNITDENGTESLTDPIDGYDVSVVDRLTGRVVSTIDRTCTHPSTARVLLSPGLNQHTYSVRFSPPATKCDPATDPPLRPTYDFDLDALSVDGSGVGTVSMPRVSTLTSGKSDGKVVPITVGVGGFVKKGETAIQANLLFRSRKLSIPTTWKTGSAFYETTGISSAENFGAIYPVQLPAGQYDVQIVPSQTDATSNVYSVTVIDHRDLTALNNTLTLTVGSKTIVRGNPTSADGAVFTLGTVDLLSADGPTIPSGALFAPLARSRTVTLVKPASDLDRAFSTSLDAGTYDVVVRIPEASGYPWLVRPRLEVPAPTTDAPRVDLQQFSAVAPVKLTGKVVDPSGDPVSRATVRARALIFEGDPDTTAPIRAVVVGETKAEEDGSYALIVPSSLLVAKATAR